MHNSILTVAVSCSQSLTSSHVKAMKKLSVNLNFVRFQLTFRFNLLILSQTAKTSGD